MKWLSVPLKKVVDSPPTIKISFQIQLSYDDPDLRKFIDRIGDNPNYYMTPMPFPEIEGMYMRGNCQFYNKDGVHLDGDTFIVESVNGCVWGWKGEPQVVILYGTFQIGTFCQTGYGHLKLEVGSGPITGTRVECKFKTLKVEPKKKV